MDKMNRKCALAVASALAGAMASAELPPLPKPWMPDPKTLPQNAGRTLTFDHPLPRQWLIGAGEKAGPGEKNRHIGTYNNGELAYPGLLSTAGSAFGEMMAQLRQVVWADRRLVFIDGRVLMCQLNWIRDHVHQSKAFCHWEHDLTSFLDFILDTPRADGQFFELIKQWTDYHWTKVNPDCVRLYPDDAQTLVRLELEADVEYLVVEGCLQAWRTTGDDAWLKRALPRLEKGIDYQTSDPKRWDAARGLCKRPYTIDTWDFLALAGGGDRRIDLDGPMAVMHGDNTGVYQAMRQLAFVNRRFGDVAKAQAWEARAATLKANVMRHLYNGRFFVHQLPLNGPPVDGHEAERLTLSDAYALNRGIWSPEENRRCIEEYRRRRETGKTFAEWYTIDPPIANACHKPGEYVNGAISPFTAGELAKGAFENGYEAYGYDILMRVAALVKRDGGKLYFLYHPQTQEPQGRGPSAWGAAAILSAIDQGLAGIQDTDKLYRTMRFAPRWAVTEHTEGRYLTGYEVSKKKVDVRWIFKENGFRYRLECPSETVDAHLFVPAGRTPQTLRVNGRATAFALSDVFGSRYVDVTVTPERGVADFEVLY